MMETRALVEEHVLQHEYDSVKAHAYYMRTRELKGRKGGKKLEEDEVPTKTKSGAKLVDFKDGVATYTDGSSYSAQGWVSGKQQRMNPARKQQLNKQLDELTARARAMTDQHARENLLMRINVVRRNINGAGAHKSRTQQIHDKLDALEEHAKKLPHDAKHEVLKKVHDMRKKLNGIHNPFHTDTVDRSGPAVRVGKKHRSKLDFNDKVRLDTSQITDKRAKNDPTRSRSKSKSASAQGK